MAIIVSADTDLIPAIDVALDAGQSIETATWAGPNAAARALSIPGRRLWNHRLGPAHFNQVRDDTNYLHR